MISPEEYLRQRRREWNARYRAKKRLEKLQHQGDKKSQSPQKKKESPKTSQHTVMSSRTTPNIKKDEESPVLSKKEAERQRIAVHEAYLSTLKQEELMKQHAQEAERQRRQQERMKRMSSQQSQRAQSKSASPKKSPISKRLRNSNGESSKRSSVSSPLKSPLMKMQKLKKRASLIATKSFKKAVVASRRLSLPSAVHALSPAGPSHRGRPSLSSHPTTSTLSSRKRLLSTASNASSGRSKYRGRDVTPQPEAIEQDETRSPGKRRKMNKPSPMKTRGLQKKTEKEHASRQTKCTLCRGTQAVDLFPCAECGAHYHLRKCMRYSEGVATAIESGRRRRWLCARCVSCSQCGEFISDALNQDCAGCALAYHGKCAVKGGKTIHGVFFCGECERHHVRVTVSPSKVRENKMREATKEELRVRRHGSNERGEDHPPKTEWRRGRKSKVDVERQRESEEMTKRIMDERNELYDQLVNIANGTCSASVSPHRRGHSHSSPSKAHHTPRSPQKATKIAVQADIDLYESAKKALQEEMRGNGRRSHLSSGSASPSRSPMMPSTSSASIASTSTSSGKKKEGQQWVYVGSRRDKMLAVYESPYPEDIVKSPQLFICPYCLRPNDEENSFRIHQSQCTWSCPPGNEIYRDDGISFFEVDGEEEKSYCRRVCLLGKLFISSKTLVDEVETFLFYILTEHTDDGCEFVGYFSKEKNPSKNNNLSCLLTLPSAQRSGYGRLLIDLSYQLSRVERKIGSPEHPLSDLGLFAYRGFWRSSILCYLRSLRGTQMASVKQISLATRIAPQDVLNQLLRDGLLLYRDGVYYVNTERRAYRMPLAVTRRRMVDHSKLVWLPSTDVKELDPTKLNYYV